MRKRTVIYDPNQPVVIRTVDHESLAALARALLEAAGIPSMAVPESFESLGAGRVQIAVRRKDVEVALEALSAPSEADGSAGEGVTQRTVWRRSDE